MVGLAFALAFESVGKQKLSDNDMLSIFSKSLHYQASRVTGSVTMFTVTARGPEMEEMPFKRLQPLVANFPAPVSDSMNWGSKHSVNLWAQIDLVIDRDHVLVNTAWSDTEGATMGDLELVMVRSSQGWNVTLPDLKTEDETAILAAGMMFLLTHKEYGYGSREDYVALKDDEPYVSVIHQKGGTKRWLAQPEDPASSLWNELGCRGYRLRPISKLPNPKSPGHPPPHLTYNAGPVQPITASQALVNISRESFSQEPGYNIDYGPSSTNFARYLAIKRHGRWRIDRLCGYWNVDPAE